jgi:hypothetical protein
MIILALDLAGVTGVAVGSPGGAPTAWSVDLGKSRSEDARFSQALVLTHKLIETHKPDLIAIEAPVGGPKTSHFLVGLVACVRGCAFNRKVRVEAYNIASIRKHFCGGHVTSAAYGHIKAPRARKEAARAAGKNLVMQRCRQMGWQADDDNAADAAALWDYACALASRSHQLTSIPGLFEGAR